MWYFIRPASWQANTQVLYTAEEYWTLSVFLLEVLQSLQAHKFPDTML